MHGQTPPPLRRHVGAGASSDAGGLRCSCGVCGCRFSGGVCSAAGGNDHPHLTGQFSSLSNVSQASPSSMRGKGATDDSAADHLQKNETCSQAINHLIQDRHLGDLLILNVGQSSRWTVADAAVHTSIGASIGIGVDAAGDFTWPVITRERRCCRGQRPQWQLRQQAHRSLCRHRRTCFRQQRGRCSEAALPGGQQRWRSGCCTWELPLTVQR